MDRREASQIEEGRFHLLVNAITDYAIYMLDKDGRINSWNPDEDSRDGLPSRALEMAARSGKFEGEGWRLRKDGSRFWAHVTIQPIRDHDGGALIGYAKITRDLTERRAERQALRTSENQLSRLVQNVTDYAIYLLDPDGHVSSWNAGAERIKGYTPDEIIGAHFSVFYTQEEQARDEPMRALQTAAREGRFATEGWRVRKDGSVFWASVVIDVILDRHEIVGFAKVTRDLTDAKKAQLNLERARDALLQSQKMAALGHLTAGVAHDFNGVLANVLGSLEVLQRRLPDDPNLTPLLEAALQAARSGNSLTQRMMAFARRQELRPEVTDVPSLVAGMMAILVRSVGPAISIGTRFPDHLDPVWVDPRQFEIAILNLALNARDAMPDGGRLIIGALEEDVASSSGEGYLAAGRYARVWVGDDGEGMDEAILVRAQEVLFTTKYPDQGAGLGLSTVQGFADHSGGRFVLRSKKGKGTVAELWLPMVTAAAGAQQDTRPEVIDGCGHRRPQDARSLTVVAVDDDRLALMQTSGMLNALGHKVFTATSGEAALDMLRRHKTVDLIILDHSMPGMTGTELAEAIRMEWPGLAVIFATPLADAHVLQISKPLRQDDLAAAITRAVSSSGFII
jgi:PAS domain S-box-containing protein